MPFQQAITAAQDTGAKAGITLAQPW